MPDYSLGKIYMIYPKVDDADESDVYYGSTTTTLSRRMSSHRSTKHCSSKILFDKYGVENCFIELVEKYPCDTKEQLNKKEGECIRNHKCINKRIAGRTGKEWCTDNKSKISEQKKEYYTENKDKITERHKEYYIDNKDKRKEYQKHYNNETIDKRKELYVKNKDKILEKMKHYYIENRNKRLEKNKQKSNCPICNKEMNKNNISRHIKSGRCHNPPQSVHTTAPESN